MLTDEQRQELHEAAMQEPQPIPLSETDLRRAELAVEELTGVRMQRGGTDWLPIIANALEEGVEAKYKLGIVKEFVSAFKEFTQILKG